MSSSAEARLEELRRASQGRLARLSGGRSLIDTMVSCTNFDRFNIQVADEQIGQVTLLATCPHQSSKRTLAVHKEEAIQALSAICKPTRSGNKIVTDPYIRLQDPINSPNAKTVSVNSSMQTEEPNQEEAGWMRSL